MLKEKSHKKSKKENEIKGNQQLITFTKLTKLVNKREAKYYKQIIQTHANYKWRHQTVAQIKKNRPNAYENCTRAPKRMGRDSNNWKVTNTLVEAGIRGLKLGEKNGPPPPPSGAAEGGAEAVSGRDEREEGTEGRS